MNRSLKAIAIASLALSVAAHTAPAKRAVAPKPPAGPPFAMRGVRLGITLDAFKAFPVIADNGERNPQLACSDDTAANSQLRLEDILPSDQEAGVVTCQWFADNPFLSSRHIERHLIDLGTGKGPPSFDFVNDGSGYRLFRISFFANNEYYDGILEALTRNYGAPKVLAGSFQVASGAVFPNTTSVWSNGSSTIILDQRCRRANCYCLTYRHDALGRVYDATKEKRAVSQAGKI